MEGTINNFGFLLIPSQELLNCQIVKFTHHVHASSG